jgi:hypothetical protein
MKITEILMAEHAVFHNLFDHIEATVPKSKTLAEVKVKMLAGSSPSSPRRIPILRTSCLSSRSSIASINSGRRTRSITSTN